MLRKLNTIILIPILVLALVHLIFMAGILTMVLPFNPIYTYIGYAFSILLLAHAAICVLLTILRIVKRDHTHKKYRGNNAALVLQIVTGIGMLILFVLHTSAYGYTDASGAFVLRAPTLQYFILESLLAITIAVHCIISIPRLAITLGLIRNKTGLKTVFMGSTAVTLICFIAAMAAYVSYYLPSVLGGLL